MAGLRERDKEGNPKNGWFAINMPAIYSVESICDVKTALTWHLLSNYKVIACFRPKA